MANERRKTPAKANKPLPDEKKADDSDNGRTDASAGTKLKKREPKHSEIQHTQNKTEMEVHHHPELEHKPKPWKEYLLEGFMIFIAVLMGFIAENIREDINNSEHVKQLTTQLVNDLKADTANLNNIYRHESQILRSNDSLFLLLQQPLDKVNTIKLQKFAADSHSLWMFHPSAGAIGAIKNELHLKQFSNSAIISYIATYEKHIELLHTVQDITLQYQRSFLDPFLYQHFSIASLDAAFYHTAIKDAKMRNLGQADLTQLAAQMVLIRINNKELIDDNLLLEKDVIDLLKYVTKQYDL
jgi:hypothetical protein